MVPVLGPWVWMMAHGHAPRCTRGSSGSAQSPHSAGLFTVICTHCELVKEKALGEITRQRLAACHSYQSLGRRIFKAFPEVSSLWGGAMDTAQLAGIVSVGWTEGPGAPVQ